MAFKVIEPVVRFVSTDVGLLNALVALFERRARLDRFSLGGSHPHDDFVDYPALLHGSIREHGSSNDRRQQQQRNKRVHVYLLKFDNNATLRHRLPTVHVKFSMGVSLLNVCT